MSRQLFLLYPIAYSRLYDMRLRFFNESTLETRCDDYDYLMGKSGDLMLGAMDDG